MDTKALTDIWFSRNVDSFEKSFMWFSWFAISWIFGDTTEFLMCYPNWLDFSWFRDFKECQFKICAIFLLEVTWLLIFYGKCNRQHLKNVTNAKNMYYDKKEWQNTQNVCRTDCCGGKGCFEVPAIFLLLLWFSACFFSVTKLWNQKIRQNVNFP